MVNAEGYCPACKRVHGLHEISAGADVLNPKEILVIFLCPISQETFMKVFEEVRSEQL